MIRGRSRSPSDAPWLLAASLALLAPGCGVALRPGRPTNVSARALSISDARSLRCLRSTPGAGSPYRALLPGPVTDQTLLPYASRLPDRARRTAVAAGIEPLFARLLQARDRARGVPTLEALSLRQELSDRVSSLGQQLLATEFECECVIALIDRTLREHDELERSRELNLTIATLVTGAGFSLGAGVWDLVNARVETPAAPDGPVVTALVGAAVTTALGASVLLPRPREIVFVREHNLLAPMITGSDPDRLYPSFVFRMLTLPTTSGAPTPRDELLATWRDLTSEAVPASRRATVDALLYGVGGTYDADALALRRRLLEALESTLDAQARDIDDLSLALATALDGQETGALRGAPEAFSGASRGPR